MFTTVSEPRFREIAGLLVSEGNAPSWFASIEYINWNGHTKDLEFIPDCALEATVLVDDVEAYVAQGQYCQWAKIEQFASPYPDSDRELLEMLERLQSGHITQ